MPEPPPEPHRARLDDAWNTEHRAETPLQRADRNFAELLQELRVLLVGVSILLGFLLALPFNSVFAGLDDYRHTVYVVALLSTALSTAVLVAPVAAHRLLFQEGHKPQLVRLAQRTILLALAGLAATLSAGLLLVLDIAIGRPTAIIVAAVFLAGLGALWVAVPLALRRG